MFTHEFSQVQENDAVIPHNFSVIEFKSENQWVSVHISLFEKFDALKSRKWHLILQSWQLIVIWYNQGEPKSEKSKIAKNSLSHQSGKYVWSWNYTNHQNLCNSILSVQMR